MSEFKYGDLCQVRDHDENEWKERIFLLTAKDGRALCVYNNNILDDFERDRDNSTWWHECRQIPQKKFIPYDYETFKPHRDKWITSKTGSELSCKVIKHVYGGVFLHFDSEVMFVTYANLISEFVFDEDGSPAGLEETEDAN